MTQEIWMKNMEVSFLKQRALIGWHAILGATSVVVAMQLVCQRQGLFTECR